METMKKIKGEIGVHLNRVTLPFKVTKLGEVGLRDARIHFDSLECTIWVISLMLAHRCL